MVTLLIRLALANILAGAAIAPALAQDISGPAQAVDGDSLSLSGISVRLYGIDAPEYDQKCTRGGEAWDCGKAAAAKLGELLARGSVRCRQRDVDDYGRNVAVCSVNGTDLGRAMVEAGMALAFRRYSDAYVLDEARAREAARGIWAGEFVAPSEWRSAHRAPQAQSQPPRSLAVPRQAPRSSVYYPNCRAARAAGAAPIYRGQPGYRPEMDGDGDGIACEPYRPR